MTEPTQIGIGIEAQSMIKELVEEGFFREERDVYRFGLSYALCEFENPQEIINRINKFHVSSIDPDGAILHAIEALLPGRSEARYVLAERLADIGVRKLYQIYRDGNLDLTKIIEFANTLK
jgi:hypothetical protein